MKKYLSLFVFVLLVAGCMSDTEKNVQEMTLHEENKKEGYTKQAPRKVKETTNSEKENGSEDTFVEEQYVVNEVHSGLDPIGDAKKEVVLLTIDDAPDTYALEMAHTLKRLNVKAIFFVNGHFLDTEEEKQVLKEIYEMGFPIGNHTMTHSKLSQLSPEKQKEEIVELSNVVADITGERPRFFRAPFGINTDISREIVASEKMVNMNWTYGYDWEKEYRTKETLTDIMINTPYLKNGANLLMHDRKWTNEALEGIVVGLKEKGFDIVDPDLIQNPYE
ncbi:polysaccharide deacetylase family protein [Bacillus timonensis]|nr:polysaccharide deacetylase family protein [Bacillus timonensis]